MLAKTCGAALLALQSCASRYYRPLYYSTLRVCMYVVFALVQRTSESQFMVLSPAGLE